ncbi:MAG: F0F1 ATP synthase subunit B [Oscillospiraceae bacterium]
MSGFESVVGVNFWTALFTFLNMIITFLLLKKFLFKPVKKMVDERQKEIDDQYADADRAKGEAEALKADYQRHLAEAKSEREEILRDATARGQKREQDIVSAAMEEANAIRQKAESDIAQEKKKALNEMKNEISGIAMEIATKVVEKEINEKDHQALVEEFIGKIGEDE